MTTKRDLLGYIFIPDGRIDLSEFFGDQPVSPIKLTDDNFGLGDIERTKQKPVIARASGCFTAMPDETETVEKLQTAIKQALIATIDDIHRGRVSGELILRFELQQELLDLQVVCHSYRPPEQIEIKHPADALEGITNLSSHQILSKLQELAYENPDDIAVYARITKALCRLDSL